MIQILISDETSQDSIAATPKTENPFYQCPHCDDNFDSFDDVTNHIEDEHENNETGKNFVSFCVILCHFVSFCVISYSMLPIISKMNMKTTLDK